MLELGCWGAKGGTGVMTSRVGGMGMPVTVERVRKKMLFGDLLVRVDIQQPDGPSEKYLEMVKKLAALDDRQVYGRIQQFESCLAELRNKHKE